MHLDALKENAKPDTTVAPPVKKESIVDKFFKWMDDREKQKQKEQEIQRQREQEEREQREQAKQRQQEREQQSRKEMEEQKRKEEEKRTKLLLITIQVSHLNATRSITIPTSSISEFTSSLISQLNIKKEDELVVKYFDEEKNRYFELDESSLERLRKSKKIRVFIPNHSFASIGKKFLLMISKI